MLLKSEELHGRSGHDVGRALLAEMFRQYTGKEMPSILITDRGKPYFAENPLHFSVTHTDAHVFCALSEFPIGIDAEELDRNINPGLADKILSPSEKSQYLAAEDKRLALLTFWVLKEAAAKCSGEGLRGYPKNTSFSLEDPRVQVREGCLLAVITANDTEEEI